MRLSLSNFVIFSIIVITFMISNELRELNYVYYGWCGTLSLEDNLRSSGSAFITMMIFIIMRWLYLLALSFFRKRECRLIHKSYLILFLQLFFVYNVSFLYFSYYLENNFALFFLVLFILVNFLLFASGIKFVQSSNNVRIVKQFFIFKKIIVCEDVYWGLGRIDLKK